MTDSGLVRDPSPKWLRRGVDASLTAVGIDHIDIHSDYAEVCVKPRNRRMACSGGLADGFLALTLRGAIADCRGLGVCLR